MNIQGKLHEIYETKQVTDKFKKRDFVVEYYDNPSFPQYVKLELHQDNTSIHDIFNVGDSLDITFDLRGKPWTNKDGVKTYFTSLVSWKIQKTDVTQNTPASQEHKDYMETGDDEGPY